MVDIDKWLAHANGITVEELYESLGLVYEV
jgi:hypothetical protein